MILIKTFHTLSTKFLKNNIKHFQISCVRKVSTCSYRHIGTENMLLKSVCGGGGDHPLAPLFTPVSIL